MPKLVKTSVRTALDLINSEALVFGKFLGPFVYWGLGPMILVADANPQQTNHTAEFATGRFLKRTTTA